MKVFSGRTPVPAEVKFLFLAAAVEGFAACASNYSPAVKQAASVINTSSGSDGTLAFLVTRRSSFDTSFLFRYSLIW